MSDRPARKDRIERAEALLAAGRIAEARQICEAVAPEDPSHTEANYLLGVAHMALGELEAAHDRFETVTLADPSHEDGWLRRGAALIAAARFSEAATCLRTLLALCPDDSAGLMHYGFCLSCLGDFEAAVPILEQAHTLTPDDDTVLFLYATALTWTAAPARAMRCLEMLTERSPDFAAGWIGKCLVHLLVGEYEIGWRLHEWRLKLPEHDATALIDATKRWHGGQDQRGKTVLLHADASFGDIIQFCRFVPAAAAKGVRVLLRVAPPLARLMRSLPDVEAIFVEDAPLPAFDLQCPIMSLPLVFGTTLETIPGRVPYLSATADLVETWSNRLAGVRGFRVGLVWAAAPRADQVTARAFGRRKSMSLAALAPLASVPDVTFVALQIGSAAREAQQPPEGMTLLDVSGQIADFADTAAIIANLDLVISVDTSVAHLAGAMGKPVWLMNLFDTDWRWMLNRDDSPWYPTLRIFRQPTSGDWDSAIRNVATALRSLPKPLHERPAHP